jgi:hypothetical protein
MVVRVCADQHAALHDLIANIDATAQLRTAINDGLVPGHGLCFGLSSAWAQPEEMLQLEDQGGFGTLFRSRDSKGHELCKAPKTRGEQFLFPSLGQPPTPFQDKSDSQTPQNVQELLS